MKSLPHNEALAWRVLWVILASTMVWKVAEWHDHPIDWTTAVAALAIFEALHAPYLHSIQVEDVEESRARRVSQIVFVALSLGIGWVLSW